MQTTASDSHLHPDRLSQAYVLTGSGAERRAAAFVRRLFCSEACGHCVACTKLDKGVHPDLVRVGPEGKNIRIEQVRQLQKHALYPPLEAPLKVFVIERAELLSREAANSLLKVLESPPPYLVFFLLTERLGDLLPTVVSRCQIVRGSQRALDGDALALCWGQPAWLDVFELDPQAPPAPPPVPNPVAIAKALGASDLAALHAATRALFEALSSWGADQVLQMAAGLSRLERPQLEYAFQGLNRLGHRQLREHPGPAALRAQRALSLSHGALRANANPQLLAESVLLKLWGALATSQSAR